MSAENSYKCSGEQKNSHNFTSKYFYKSVCGWSSTLKSFLVRMKTLQGFLVLFHFWLLMLIGMSCSENFNAKEKKKKAGTGVTGCCRFLTVINEIPENTSGSHIAEAEQNEANDLRAKAALRLKAERALNMQ